MDLNEIMNVKIVKMCDSKDKSKEVSCEEIQFDDESFIESIVEEILNFDYSIVVENVPEVSRKSSSICFNFIPQKLNEQISLPIDDVESLSFYESFIISENVLSTKDISTLSSDINNIGSSTVMVEELEDGNILVFATQQVFVNNERICQESLSVVTKGLKLIHEKMNERRCNESTFTEKSLFITSTDNFGYRLVKTSTKDNVTEQYKSNVEWKKSGDFLSSGAIALLMRYLVIKNFNGCIHSYTCNIDGEFVLCQHSFHEREEKLVNEELVDVQRVDQLIILNDGNFALVLNNYTENGRLVNQICENLNYFMHMNSLNVNTKKSLTKCLQDNWMNDVQLMSIYLENKAKRKEELRIKFDSPYVKLSLKDYIQNLIKCKPQCIMNFTLEFIKKLEQNNGKVNEQKQELETGKRRHQQK